MTNATGKRKISFGRTPGPVPTLRFKSIFQYSAVSIQVGFTLSQATKALRESRGIALFYFRPLHQKGVRVQRHAPAATYPRERPGTHCTGGWLGLRAGLDWCGKSRPTGIRSPDRPARRQSLYRLRYPAHIGTSKYHQKHNLRWEQQNETRHEITLKSAPG